MHTCKNLPMTVAVIFITRPLLCSHNNKNESNAEIPPMNTEARIDPQNNEPPIFVVASVAFRYDAKFRSRNVGITPDRNLSSKVT